MRETPKPQADRGAVEGELALAAALIEARKHAELTQEQLAARMQTSQASIARLEAARGNPSLQTLRRYAEATGTQLRVIFEA